MGFSFPVQNAKNQIQAVPARISQQTGANRFGLRRIDLTYLERFPPKPRRSFHIIPQKQTGFKHEKHGVPRQGRHYYFILFHIKTPPFCFRRHMINSKDEVSSTASLRFHQSDTDSIFARIGSSSIYPREPTGSSWILGLALSH